MKKKTGQKIKITKKKPNQSTPVFDTYTRQKKVWLKINARNVRNGKQHTFELNVEKKEGKHRFAHG